MTDNVLEAINYFKNNRISITACAKQFGIHRETLTKYLKQSGNHENRNAYSIDDKFFEIIDTEAKAYWLGFILADGCIKKNGSLSIRVSINDIKHLEKFKTAIKCECPIKTELLSTFGSVYESCVFTIKNSIIQNNLLMYGIENNKSCNERFSNLVPDHLMNHYIRGIYDGDGWISWNIDNHTCEIGFGMGEECLKNIKNIFESQEIKEYPVKPYKNIFRYRITSKSEVSKALKYLYNDATIFLDRKHMRFIEFCRLESKACTTEDSR